MDANSIIIEYMPLIMAQNTIESHYNSFSVIARKETPFLELAKKICIVLRTTTDCTARILGNGFIDMYRKNTLPILAKREADTDNVDIFEMYYLDHLSKDEIMEKFQLEDERTFYKKLDRSKELFAIAIYDFLMFVNK